MTASIQRTSALPGTGPANIAEIGKFAFLVLTWLCIIFGAVWVACFLVGVLAPTLVEQTIQPKDLAQNLANVLRLLTPIVAVMVFIPINAMFMVLAERRALALFTMRKGPNRVGLFGFKMDGFLQTAADAVKLLFKEDITPRGADLVMFTLAPIIFFAPSIIAGLPLLAAATGNHELFRIANLPTGIFYVLAISSIPVVGIVMGGWASNNKYSLVGGLRSAAQAISYEIPLVLAIITICLLAGSFTPGVQPQEAGTLDVVRIVDFQQGGILHWNLLGGGALVKAMSSPLSLIPAVALVACCVLLFGIYLTGACAEVNRIPFDLPEAESELVSGYNTEYSGIKFAIFFLAEFTNLFIVCSIATVMFLGGGASPIPGQMLGINAANFVVPAPFNMFFDPVTFSKVIWVIIKTYTLVIFAILVRATLPRFRIDQLMDFGWKRLIPLSLFLLIAVTFLKELV